MKKLLFIAFVLGAAGIYSLFLPTAPKVRADTTVLSPYSWDPGLFATVDPYNDSVHSWGQRKTTGAWGTGEVNYQSGATSNYRGSTTGTLNVVL
ncbi:hypothetical protein EBQ81_02835 [bacterium]|nr:hypothetical protein [bacterium]